ncbi:MAG: hypothetical protein K2I82_02970 [Ruminococcus sp.]|nr:hypothetical protein [Ruminococcus sp.]
MHENIEKIVRLGRIPKDDDMSDELFNEYDSLIQIDYDLSYEEAECLVTLFSDDCYDLNWDLLHTIETVFSSIDTERYRSLIEKCNNEEFRKILCIRLQNYLNLSHE